MPRVKAREALIKSRVVADVRHRRRNGFAEQTILNELHALSSVCELAEACEVVEANPIKSVKKLLDVGQREVEATWLEHHEAVVLLEQCFALDDRPGQRCPYFGPITATFLLTGGRKREVFGIEVRDVDVDQGYIHFQPNVWRNLDDGLKSRHATRRVPLWRQLRDILEVYIAKYRPDADGLLFPPHLKVVQAPYSDLYDALRGAAQRAGLAEKFTAHRNKWHLLRHTYTSHRLYTTEGGVPVATLTVARELGHRDEDLIRRRYGHVLQERDRQERWKAEVRFERTKVLPITRSA